MIDWCSCAERERRAASSESEAHLLAGSLNAAQQLQEALLAQGRRIRRLQRAGAAGHPPPCLGSLAPPCGRVALRALLRPLLLCRIVLSAVSLLLLRRCQGLQPLGPLHLGPCTPVDVGAVVRLAALRQPLAVAWALGLVLVQLALQHGVAAGGVPGAGHALGAAALPLIQVVAAEALAGRGVKAAVPPLALQEEVALARRPLR